MFTRTLMALLGPLKFELFFTFIIFFVPLILILTIFSNKIERFIFFIINYTTSRAPTIENISFTKEFEYFKGTIYGNNLHVGDILAVLFLIVVIVKKEFRKHFSLIPSGTIPFLLYCICSSVSVINSSPLTEERSWYAITMHIRQVIFFYCLANYLRIPGRREYQLKSFFFIAIYSMLSAIHQRYGLGYHRVAADFAHPNGMVFYLVPILVIFMPILFNSRENNYNKKIAIFTVFAVLVTSLMSISRGLIFHLGVGLTTVILIDFTFKFNIKKPLIIIGMLFSMTIASMKAWDTWYERLTGATNPAGTFQRQSYYIIGWEVFKANMWFGLGINQFASNAYTEEIIDRVLDYKFVQNTPEVKKFMLTFGNMRGSAKRKGLGEKYWYRGGTPESFYVLHFAETGLVGMFGTMVCQIFFIVSALRSVIYFRRRNIFFYSLSVGLVGSQLGIYMQSIFEYILRQENPMYLQAILLAMVSSVTAVRKSKRFDNVNLYRDAPVEILAKEELPPPLPVGKS